MLEWYRFILNMDNNGAFEKAQSLFTNLLVNSGGMSGIALFYKNDYAEGQNVFYAAIPAHMSMEKDLVNRLYPLTPCERPTGLDLCNLVSGVNDLEDYCGICKEWKL
jgi:hypothetical protein